MSGKPINVPFGYLPDQFSEIDSVMAEIRLLTQSGDYTLGAAVTEFEQQFAAFQQGRYAIGVNSGTDALKLSFRALGIGHGDEVVTAANTFIGTVSAILDIGAVPVFVDVDASMQMEPDQLETVMTSNTRAVVPVHWAGDIGRIEDIVAIADRHAVPIVEDACQAVGSSREGKRAGHWSQAAAFSLHPQKFLNIWGDGGVIVTDDEALADQLRLLRNHGLQTRDLVVVAGVNSRLDTLQALVARHVLVSADSILARRRRIASRYDEAFAAIDEIEIPRSKETEGHSFVTYQIFCEQRNELLACCEAAGIEAKIHYPVPVYRQPCLGGRQQKGAFPETDRQADRTLTLPVHQHLSDEQVDHVIDVVTRFFRQG